VRTFSLPPNQLHHFYRGGPAIAALRGIPSEDPQAPEDWLGAVNTRLGEETTGLGRLDDGRFVRDAVLEDPEGFLGAEHVARYGPDTYLLVKLLDAGQRLPVHYHPDRAFAREHAGTVHGKTEAWLIIEGTQPGASVGIGFREEADRGQVREWIASQDSEAMLASLQPLDVAPGDSLLVPAGVPHAIGEGIFMVEVQEPSDLSVLMEWTGFDLDGEDEANHLGLGFEKALESLDVSPWDAERVAGLLGPRGATGPMLPVGADPFFRAERIQGATSLDPGFAVLVVLDGEGTLRTQAEERPLARGDTLLIPHAAGPGEITGEVTAIRARPPAPDAPEAS
jgi:mannose-6-phosphate isomerase